MGVTPIRISIIGDDSDGSRALNHFSGEVEGVGGKIKSAGLKIGAGLAAACRLVQHRRAAGRNG
jgi:hypothetical protein